MSGQAGNKERPQGFLFTGGRRQIQPDNRFHSGALEQMKPRRILNETIQK